MSEKELLMIRQSGKDMLHMYANDYNSNNFDLTLFVNALELINAHK